MNKLKLILVLSLTLVSGTTRSETVSNGHDKTETNSVVTIEVSDIPADFKIPTKLWDKLVSTDGPIKNDGSVTDEKEEKKDTLIVWVPVEVSFLAKVSGILTHESVQYNLPRGGGALDLAKITSGDKGSFFLKFNLYEFSNTSSVKVYFVSNAKKRRVDGEIFGAGCNVYFDITKAFQRDNSDQGIKFNITDNRHVSALSGHFIFVQTDKDKVYLSQVEFNDSQNRDYLCKI